VDDNPVVPEEPKPSIPEPFIGPPVPKDSANIIIDFLKAMGVTIVCIVDDPSGIGFAYDVAIAVAWGAFIAEHGEAIMDDVDGVVTWFAEHTKNRWPSNEEKHEKGQARKRKDAGNEKGDSERTQRNPKRK
jgi:hypothetical protein